MLKKKALRLAKNMRGLCGVVCGLLIVLSGSIWLSWASPELPADAWAAEDGIPPYVESPVPGSYTIGGENNVQNTDGHARTGTEFYLLIENPDTDETGQDRNQTSAGVYYRGQLVSGSSGYSGGSTPGGLTTGGTAQSGVTVGSLSSGLPGTFDSGYPKTGDYGPDKALLLTAALLFGTCYLLCDYYEKKYI
jgi:hypothetical protein